LKQKKLIEEFLHFIVVLATERTKSGMSDDAKIRREIIHRLSVEDLTYSSLTSAIVKPLTSNISFDRILNEVSVFQKPKQMEQGTYQLKSDCWNEFDRNFPHFTRVRKQQTYKHNS
jgi:hypothetical protein